MCYFLSELFSYFLSVKHVSTFYYLDESWHSSPRKTMTNTQTIEDVQSIAQCWEEAKNQSSPFFYWNGTCNLSKTLINSEKIEMAKSFAQCRELAINEKSTFFYWNSNENGACYLSKDGLHRA